MCYITVVKIYEHRCMVCMRNISKVYTVLTLCFLDWSFRLFCIILSFAFEGESSRVSLLREVKKAETASIVGKDEDGCIQVMKNCIVLNEGKVITHCSQLTFPNCLYVCICNIKLSFPQSIVNSLQWHCTYSTTNCFHGRGCCCHPSSFCRIKMVPVCLIQCSACLHRHAHEHTHHL